MNLQNSLYTQKQAAAYFGVTVRTLLEWRKAGIIKAIKINDLVRYHPDEIKRVLKENREKTRKPKRKYF